MTLNTAIAAARSGLFIALLIVLGLSPSALAAGVNHVFIVSFDGGKPAVMQESAMPLFKQMLQQGAGTWQAHTVVPSITLVAHTSMLTGLVPGKHRIHWNEWRMDKGLVHVPTIFALAKQRGLSTALFAGKDKFRHLNVPHSLDEFSIPGYYAQQVAQAAAAYIEAKKPNLMFVHFADTDGLGHQYGWGSQEQKVGFAAADKALATLRQAIATAGLEKDSVVLLTADHGGHDKGHGSDSPDDVLIPWVAWGKTVRPGYTLTERVNVHDTAATALWLLGIPIPQEFDGVALKAAFTQ